MDKVINILLIEDDYVDIIDVQRSLDKLNILHKTHIAKNGEEALHFLNSNNGADPAPKPDIVLLDLNMPKMNGIEFLTAIRSNNALKDLKVFVITTSEEKVDKEAVRKLGISGYIVKPLKLSNPSSIDSFNLMIDLMNVKSRI